METKLLTVIEAAQYLKMGRSTVYKLAQEGKLPKDGTGASWSQGCKDHYDLHARFEPGWQGCQKSDGRSVEE